MKRFILIIILITIYSCKNEQKKSFDGFGELIIGKDFSKIPSYKLFEVDTNSIMVKDEKKFILNKYELSKEFGIVENVEVRTLKDKIHFVSFYRGKYTNTNAIDSFLVDRATNTESVSQRSTYLSNNQYVELWIFSENRISDNLYTVRYGYSDLVTQNKIQSINDSINEAEENVQKIKARNEYIKDLKKI